MNEAASKPVRSNARWTTVLVLLVPVVFLLMLASVWMYLQMQVRGKIADLRARGLPTNAAELNAYYKIPDGEADATEIWVKTIDAIRKSGIDIKGKALPIVGTSGIEIPPPGMPWSQLDDARTFVTDHSKELKQIHDAVNTPGAVRFPVDFSPGFNTLLPYTQDIRRVTRLLQLDAYVKAHDGNDAGALEDIRGLFVTAQVLSHEPIMISQMVRWNLHSMGCRSLELILPASNWNEDELHQLRTLIAQADIHQGWNRAVPAELAMGLITFDQQQHEPIRTLSKLRILDRSPEQTALAAVPFPEILPQVEAFRIRNTKDDWQKKLDDLLGLRIMTSLNYEIEKGLGRAIARQRLAIALIDAQRFRLKEGRLPDSLSELAAAFPVAVPPGNDQRIDPYDGLPLRFISNEQEIILYSIGDNLIDDGGNLSPDRDPLDLGMKFPR